LTALCGFSFFPQLELGGLEYTTNSCNAKMMQQSDYFLNGRQEDDPIIINQDPLFASLKACMEMYWPDNNEGKESP
jgi:hypothetical protein